MAGHGRRRLAMAGAPRRCDDSAEDRAQLTGQKTPACLHVISPDASDCHRAPGTARRSRSGMPKPARKSNPYRWAAWKRPPSLPVRTARLVAPTRLRVGFWRLASRHWELSHRFRTRRPGESGVDELHRRRQDCWRRGHAMEEIQAARGPQPVATGTWTLTSPAFQSPLLQPRGASWRRPEAMIQFWTCGRFESMAPWISTGRRPRCPPEQAGQRLRQSPFS